MSNISKMFKKVIIISLVEIFLTVQFSKLCWGNPLFQQQQTGMIPVSQVTATETHTTRAPIDVGYVGTPKESEIGVYYNIMINGVFCIAKLERLYRTINGTTYAIPQRLHIYYPLGGTSIRVGNQRNFETSMQTLPEAEGNHFAEIIIDSWGDVRIMTEYKDGERQKALVPRRSGIFSDSLFTLATLNNFWNSKTVPGPCLGNLDFIRYLDNLVNNPESLSRSDFYIYNEGGGWQQEPVNIALNKSVEGFGTPERQFHHVQLPQHPGLRCPTSFRVFHDIRTHAMHQEGGIILSEDFRHDPFRRGSGNKFFYKQRQDGTKPEAMIIGAFADSGTFTLLITEETIKWQIEQADIGTLIINFEIEGGNIYPLNLTSIITQPGHSHNGTVLTYDLTGLTGSRQSVPFFVAIGREVFNISQPEGILNYLRENSAEQGNNIFVGSLEDYFTIATTLKGYHLQQPSAYMINRPNELVSFGTYDPMTAQNSESELFEILKGALGVSSKRDMEEELRTIGQSFEDTLTSLEKELSGYTIGGLTVEGWAGKLLEIFATTAGFLDKGLRSVEYAQSIAGYVFDYSKLYGVHERAVVGVMDGGDAFLSDALFYNTGIDYLLDDNKGDGNLRDYLERVKALGMISLEDQNKILATYHEYREKHSGWRANLTSGAQQDVLKYIEENNLQALLDCKLWKQAFITYLRINYPQLVVGGSDGEMVVGELQGVLDYTDVNWLDIIAYTITVGVIGVEATRVLKVLGAAGWLIPAGEISRTHQLAIKLYTWTSRAVSFVWGSPLILLSEDKWSNWTHWFTGWGGQFMTGFIYSGIFGYAFPIVRAMGGGGSVSPFVFTIQNQLQMWLSEILLEEIILPKLFENIIFKDSIIFTRLRDGVTTELPGHLAEFLNPVEIAQMFVRLARGGRDAIGPANAMVILGIYSVLAYILQTAEAVKGT